MRFLTVTGMFFGDSIGRQRFVFTPFHGNVQSLYPLKTKARSFLTFSGGIEMQRGRNMG